MRVIVTLAMALVAFAASASAASACGVERWSAKVLADGTTQLTGPYNATVAQLQALQRPFAGEYYGARVSAERVAYRIQGELLGYKLESDGDIHLVVADPGNRSATLVAEIPDPKCMAGAPATYVRDVAQARLAFVRTFGIPPVTHFALAYKPITIVGPAFFDFEHGQNGSAPNDLEIHPALIVDNSLSLPIASGDVQRYRAPATDSAPENGAPSCPGDTPVWVNLRSGIFHLPGTRYYGHTARGQFMCERAALAAGYRAALNE